MATLYQHLFGFLIVASLRATARSEFLNRRRPSTCNGGFGMKRPQAALRLGGSAAQPQRFLEGNVAVLLGGIPIAFPLQGIESLDQPRPRIARVDDVIQITPARCDVRMREL